MLKSYATFFYYLNQRVMACNKSNLNIATITVNSNNKQYDAKHDFHPFPKFEDRKTYSQAIEN